MSVVELLYVDRDLLPVAGANTTSLPRNAQLLMKFSQDVDPASVTTSSIQVRTAGSVIPIGSLFTDGNHVRFDPTVTAIGLPNPVGFDPMTPYTVFIPSFVDPDYNALLGVVTSRAGERNGTSLRTGFTTEFRFLREQVPPQVLEVRFEPEPNPGTGEIRADGRMAVVFSEAMDVTSFVLGNQNLPLDPIVTIDVRYDAGPQVNVDNQVAGLRVPGTITFDTSATIAYFQPFFSFGAQPLVFGVQCLEWLTDLVGNRLANPRSFGSFTCDGTGSTTGQILSEEFLNDVDSDSLMTDALWGTPVRGTCQGQPLTSRQARVFGYKETSENGASGRGQYASIADPLTGVGLVGSALGRRVMLAFHDYEIGARGTITAAAWGPDSNATFAALHSNVILRMGYQATASMELGPSFSANYLGGPRVVYEGVYEVPQRADVGNTPGEPTVGHVGGYPDFCTGASVWNLPLFNYTGFAPWPAFTSFFEWDPGTEAEDDVVLLFDMSATEGTTWQVFRAWYASIAPCFLPTMVPGYPRRRLYSLYESDAGIPEETVYDTAFTVSKHHSLAQSLFYTYPGHPAQAYGGTTFGDQTNYRPVALMPSLQLPGVRAEIEFQGADSVGVDRRTIDPAAPFTSWTKNIDDCDGMRCIRWRIRLRTNIQNAQVAKLTRVTIPMTYAP
jgi:hypothetical protein